MTGSNILKIDGSFGEGGGAILRVCSGFSMLFNKPIEIYNIRANRPNPGLRLQHLLGIQTLSKLTNSTLSECRVGSKEIKFFPNYNIKNFITIDITTAASLGLLLQPIQIASFGLKENKIEINLNGGGTFGKWAPSLDYLKEVTYNIFKTIGLKIDIEILRHGFYPKGGAHVKCVIHPSKKELKPLNLTELGTINYIRGSIVITNQLKRQKNNVGDRILKTITRFISNQLNLETQIQVNWVDSFSPGIGLSLWANSDTGAIISTGTILGEKQITSEKLGKIAVNTLMGYIKNQIPVDNYLSDQLIPLMSILNHSSIKVREVTNHTKTNLELVRLFTHRDYHIIKEYNSSIIEFK